MFLATCLGLLAATASQAQPTIFEKADTPVAAGGIDALIFAKLKEQGVQPAQLCSDAVFLRRVYLGVIGTLPTADEARAFLADQAADKRAKLIDRLLEREEFADYAALRWGDVLRVKSEFPINLWPQAAQAYHHWLRAAIKANMPYDQFARELLTSNGSNFRVPQVNFYRAVQVREPAGLARTVALTFMGDRLGSWPEERKNGLAVFFSRVAYKATGEWKEEIILFDPATKAAPSATLPDGSVVKLASDQDPRQAFADWLVAPGNPWFARCAVNRIWYWLLGRGLIQEPDDIRPDNPASYPEVLALLEKELVAAKYDQKRIYRLILNSSVYQLSSVSPAKEPPSPERFACYPLRRLDAEVLIDALCQVTGTTEEYSSRVPEPFTWVPTEIRSIALPDGSITSSFLELFGRPPRDTGMAAERNNAFTAAQRLHLLNSGHIRNKIERGKMLPVLRTMSQKDPLKGTNELYLTALSRYPTAEELAAFKTYADESRTKKNPNPLIDMMWALINSPEFLYQH
jgi:hypothetical protein